MSEVKELEGIFPMVYLFPWSKSGYGRYLLIDPRATVKFGSINGDFAIKTPAGVWGLEWHDGWSSDEGLGHLCFNVIKVDSPKAEQFKEDVKYLYTDSIYGKVYRAGDDVEFCYTEEYIGPRVYRPIVIVDKDGVPHQPDFGGSAFENARKNPEWEKAAVEYMKVMAHGYKFSNIEESYNVHFRNEGDKVIRDIEYIYKDDC